MQVKKTSNGYQPLTHRHTAAQSTCTSNFHYSNRFVPAMNFKVSTITRLFLDASNSLEPIIMFQNLLGSNDLINSADLLTLCLQYKGQTKNQYLSIFTAQSDSSYCNNDKGELYITRYIQYQVSGYIVLEYEWQLSERYILCEYLLSSSTDSE